MKIVIVAVVMLMMVMLSVKTHHSLSLRYGDLRVSAPSWYYVNGINSEW